MRLGKALATGIAEEQVHAQEAAQEGDPSQEAQQPHEDEQSAEAAPAPR